MELESMKSLWEVHDKELKKVSALNDQMLNRIIREKSRHSIEKIKNAEYFMGAAAILFLVLFLLMGNQLGGRPEMIISYIITVSAFVVTLAWGAYKLAYLSRIDMGAGAVTDTTAKARRFQLLIVRERLVSLLSLFVIAPAVYILVFQWVRHRSALEFLSFSITEVVLVLVLVIVFSLILYRRVYLDRLRSIIASLKEIEDFKKEGKALLAILFLLVCGPAITKTTAATGNDLHWRTSDKSVNNVQRIFDRSSVGIKNYPWPGGARKCFLEGDAACREMSNSNTIAGGEHKFKDAGDVTQPVK